MIQYEICSVTRGPLGYQRSARLPISLGKILTAIAHSPTRLKPAWCLTGCPLHDMHNIHNSPQSPAKEGAKNLRVNIRQPRIEGCDGLPQDPRTFTGQNQKYTSKKSKKPEASKVNSDVHEPKGVLHIGTYNIRSLLGEDRIVKLEEELKKHQVEYNRSS